MLNVYDEAISFLEYSCSEALDLSMRDEKVFTATFKFFGHIASTNRLGTLYIGGDGINVFYSELDQYFDDRFTVFIGNVANDLIIRLNSMEKGGYDRLVDLLRDSVKRTIASDVFPTAIKDRIDIELLDDPIYLTFYMLQPALLSLIIKTDRRIGVHNAAAKSETTN